MSQHTDPLSAQDLTVIADKLGAWVGNALDPSQPTPRIEIGESFRVCFLRGDGVAHAKRSGLDLVDVAELTERFHHQIRFNGVAAAFARSLRTITPSGTSWSIREFGMVPLAHSVEKAIHVADPVLTDADPTIVRLIEAPTYAVHALWLTRGHGKDRVVTATAPPHFRAVHPFQLVPSSEFLAELSRESEIEGFY